MLRSIISNGEINDHSSQLFSGKYNDDVYAIDPSLHDGVEDCVVCDQGVPNAQQTGCEMCGAGSQANGGRCVCACERVSVYVCERVWVYESWVSK